MPLVYIIQTIHVTLFQLFILDRLSFDQMYRSFWSIHRVYKLFIEIEKRQL